MSETPEADAAPEPGPAAKPAFGRPRGPRTAPFAGLGSWDSERQPVAAEQRETLAAAELDACYRWAAPAVGGRETLDIGCAAGHGARLLAGAGAASVTAVDHRPEAIAAAERSAGAEGVRFLGAEPLALPFPPRSFGAITCFGSVEATPEPDRLLEGLGRALEPGGILLATLPLTPLLDPIDGRPLTEQRSGESWRSAIAGLLGNVRLHRLRTSFAAVVGPEAEAGNGGSSVVETGAWLGAEPSEDRALLVVAGDGELPALPPVATLVGSRDLRDYRDTVAAWEQRARRAEAEGAAKHWELVASREAQRRLRKRLHELEHRPLRRLSRLLRGRPARLGPGPPIRASELEPEPWD